MGLYFPLCPDDNVVMFAVHMFPSCSTGCLLFFVRTDPVPLLMRRVFEDVVDFGGAFQSPCSGHLPVDTDLG